jgi:hypothetical protein
LVVDSVSSAGRRRREQTQIGRTDHARHSTNRSDVRIRK